MVNEQEQDSGLRPANQGVRDVIPEPNKIGASTPFDFNGKNLTPYGGLLPVITMLEKLGFQSLVEQTLNSKRIPRAMGLYRFVLGIVLGLYIGFPRLNQLRFIARDPILTGILQVTKLPVQSTFWRFVNGLHRNVARQLLTIMRTMRERVWEAANVKLEVVTIDTDTTVHTLYGQQMGGRKGYNPKNKGKKSYQPILTFLAETREYVWGELRNGDRPSGKQIQDHLRNVAQSMPASVKQLYGRADQAFTAGKPLKGMKKLTPGSSSVHAKRLGWSKNCAKRSGSLRPRLMPTRNANSVISQMDGASRIGSSPYAKKSHARNWQPRKPSNISCSKPASTRIESW